ncbi:MAG: AAA family ATPase [Planctomycetales bacterium]
MRLARLDLLAYGHFTQCRVPLSPGLNLVYGPNEAGKSTALRGLKNFLFGFETKCSDGFLHGLPKLRVGAVIETTSGERIECIRRKAQKDTLWTAGEQKVLSPALLEGLLQGVDRRRFETQFGITYEQLVAGGRAICDGEGDLGEILFAAASGVASLSRIRLGLDTEAEALFKQQGQLPVINRAVKEFTDKTKEVREFSIPPATWEEQSRSVKRTSTQRDELNHRLQAVRAERERLERIRKALPLLAERDRLDRALEQLGPVPALPDDFQARCVRSQSEAAHAERELVDLDERSKLLKSQWESLPATNELLQYGVRIDALQESLGSVRTGRADRVTLMAQAAQCRETIESRIAALGRDLSVDQAPRLAAPRPLRTRLQNLSTAGLKGMKDLESCEAQRDKLEQREGALHSRLQGLPPVASADELRAAVRAAAQRGALEAERDRQQTLHVRGLEQAQVELARLGLWQGNWAELERLALPSDQTLQRCEALWSAAADLERDLTRRWQEASQKRDELAGRLEALRLEQDVPTEQDLELSRAQRDRLWKLVRRRLERPGAEPSDEERLLLENREPGELSPAYERKVAEADDLADRLRREGEAVARKAQLLADEGAQRERCAALEADLNVAHTRRAQEEAQWHALWQPLGITPLPPAEMRDWARRCRELAARGEPLRQQACAVALLEEQIAQHKVRLTVLLEQQGQAAPAVASLAELVELAQERVDALQETSSQRDEIERQLSEVRVEVEAAQRQVALADERLAEWRAQWRDCLVDVSLAEGTSAEEAVVVMQEQEEIAALADKWRELERRIAGIDERSREFQAAVAGLVAALELGAEARVPEEALEALVRRRQAAQQTATRRDGLEQQLAENASRWQTARDRRQHAADELALLCQLAGGVAINELLLVDERARQASQWRQEREVVRRRLDELAQPGTLAALEHEAAQARSEELSPRIENLQSEHQRLSDERDAVLTRLGEEQQTLATMNGSSRAAEAQEQCEALLARIRTEAEHFVRLKLASKVLEGALERFRERNQGPILERASQLFAKLTLGGFTGLEATTNDKGKPTLLGVRADGGSVPLDGMSSGAGDQLFLALRVAWLQHHFQEQPPIPFLVDDVLIMFDDHRAKAALDALRELAAQTQVIVFTHHAHLVELAERSLPPGSWHSAHLAR